MKKEDMRFYVLVGLIVISLALSATSLMVGTSGATGKYWWTGTGGVAGGYTTKDILFPVDAWGFTGWGVCNQHAYGIKAANMFCVYHGYTEAIECYHEASQPERWLWNVCVTGVEKVGTSTGTGTALTRVKCQ